MNAGKRMAKRHITIPIFIPNLGCPHRCIYCDQRATSGASAIPDGNAIDGKIRSCLSTAPKSVARIEAAFFGGNFTGLPARLQEEFLEKASGYVRTGDIHGIRLSTRPDCISPRGLDLLGRYGVETIELGVQSLCDRVLAQSLRGHTAEDVYRAVALIREHGMRVVLQLMAGLPGDTGRESLLTARAAAELAPDGVRIFPAVVLKHTGLAELYTRGAYRPLGLEEAVTLCTEMFLAFESRGIPVIRMGLHPLGPMEERNVLAGPYHPSFGFLVRSRARRDVMEEKVADFLGSRGAAHDGRISIRLPEKNKEEYLGHKKENIAFLAGRFGLHRVAYSFDLLDGVSVECVMPPARGSGRARRCSSWQINVDHPITDG